MAPKPEEPILARMPDSVERYTFPFEIQGSARWFVLADMHIPFHEKPIIDLGIKLARKEDVVGVLLNGDQMDFHVLSKFDKTPDDPRYKEEVHKGREMLAYLRLKFPRARIIWKDGNHEERLHRFLCRKAPELYGLDVLSIPSLFMFADYGIEYVTDRRVIQLGDLSVIHGHEYPGTRCPVNPARAIYLKAKGSVLCGHWHQISAHHAQTISGKPQTAWSTGCACGLKPPFATLNDWEHGFAFVEIFQDGGFKVRNLQVIDGKAV
jgi:predicted phosphodiesterase